MRIAWIGFVIFVYVLTYLADLWYCSQAFGPGMSSVVLNNLMYWQIIKDYSGTIPVDIIMAPFNFFSAVFTITSMDYAMFRTDWGWWVRLAMTPCIGTAIFGLIYGFITLVSINK